MDMKSSQQRIYPKEQPTLNFNMLFISRMEDVQISITNNTYILENDDKFKCHFRLRLLEDMTVAPETCI